MRRAVIVILAIVGCAEAASAQLQVRLPTVSDVMTTALGATTAIPPPPDRGPRDDLDVKPLPWDGAAAALAPIAPAKPVSAPVQTTTLFQMAIDVRDRFPGLGADSGYSSDVAPPDTVGAAGRDHFFQWVNTAFAIFKRDGTRVYGPAEGNTLWTGFKEDACRTQNDGDPTVLYDAAADRWVVSQFAVKSGPPYFQCVAVSQTSDPLGRYARYSYKFDDFNDYGKFAVWGDNYLAIFNLFKGKTFLRTNVCALDREAMIKGASNSRMICFDVALPAMGLLPVTLDGPGIRDTRGYFIGFPDRNGDTLAAWRLDVAWSQPPRATLTPLPAIKVQPFTPAVCDFLRAWGECIEQKGSREILSTVGDRLMYRAAARRIGNELHLVVNHSVVAPGRHVGIRWYELLLEPQRLTVLQQGTYALPDAERWLGTGALDHAGNLVIVFNAAGDTLFPSLRAAARRPSDPSGTLSDETTLTDGLSAQEKLRWGDYAAIVPDPADPCLLWFTGEYGGNAGRWHTLIASIRVQSCVR